MRHCAGMLAVLIATGIVVVGCAAPTALRPFDAAGQQWPLPPDPARVRYVTSFSTSSDLGIEPSAWSRLVRLIAGKETEGMVRPMAVAATADGDLIAVADPGAHCVHRFDLRRRHYDCLVAGSGSVLTSPVGITIAQDGRLFVADSSLDTVFVAQSSDGYLKPLMLSPSPRQPTGVAIGTDGELFVSSTGTHSVRRYDATGQLIREYGERGTGRGQMNYPTYIWFAAPTELVVADTLNFRVQRFDVNQGVLGAFGNAGDGTGDLARPKGIAEDRHGHVYVVDGLHHAVQVFDRDGLLLLVIGGQGQGEGEFWLPSGIFITVRDLIFVADSYNRRVQVFRYVGSES